MNVRLLMDKVKVRIEFRLAIGLDDEYRQMHEFKSSVCDGEFIPKGKVWTCSRAALTSINQPLNDETNLFIKYGYSHGRHFAWFEFNPSKCDGDAFAKIKGYLNLLLEDGCWSLIVRGVVTYSELAIDINDAKFSDYLFIDTSLRSGSNAYESIGTAYLGSKLGGRSFTCYDKRKEMLNKGAPDLGQDRLRIEAKLRGASACDFAELFERECPFSTLLVLDAKELALSTDPIIVSFRSHLASSTDSVQKIYSSQLKSVRAKLRDSFKGVTAKWWQPNLIWEHYPLSLNWIDELLK